jgi:hypothetical protein
MSTSSPALVLATTKYGGYVYTTPDHPDGEEGWIKPSLFASQNGLTSTITSDDGKGKQTSREVAWTASDFVKAQITMKEAKFRLESCPPSLNPMDLFQPDGDKPCIVEVSGFHFDYDKPVGLMLKDGKVYYNAAELPDLKPDYTLHDHECAQFIKDASKVFVENHFRTKQKMAEFFGIRKYGLRHIIDNIGIVPVLVSAKGTGKSTLTEDLEELLLGDTWHIVDSARLKNKHGCGLSDRHLGATIQELAMGFDQEKQTAMDTIKQLKGAEYGSGSRLFETDRRMKYHGMLMCNTNKASNIGASIGDRRIWPIFGSSTPNPANMDDIKIRLKSLLKSKRSLLRNEYLKFIESFDEIDPHKFMRTQSYLNDMASLFSKSQTLTECTCCKSMHKVFRLIHNRKNGSVVVRLSNDSKFSKESDRPITEDDWCDVEDDFNELKDRYEKLGCSITARTTEVVYNMDCVEATEIVVEWPLLPTEPHPEPERPFLPGTPVPEPTTNPSPWKTNSCFGKGEGKFQCVNASVPTESTPKTADVTNFSRMVFESDTDSLETQYGALAPLWDARYIRSLHWSGNKSIHAFVQLSKDCAPTNPDEYKQAYPIIAGLLRSVTSLNFDGTTSNPGRICRDLAYADWSAKDQDFAWSIDWRSMVKEPKPVPRPPLPKPRTKGLKNVEPPPYEDCLKYAESLNKKDPLPSGWGSGQHNLYLRRANAVCMKNIEKGWGLTEAEVHAVLRPYYPQDIWQKEIDGYTRKFFK